MAQIPAIQVTGVSPTGAAWPLDVDIIVAWASEIIGVGVIDATWMAGYFLVRPVWNTQVETVQARYEVETKQDQHEVEIIHDYDTFYIEVTQ